VYKYPTVGFRISISLISCVVYFVIQDAIVQISILNWAPELCHCPVGRHGPETQSSTSTVYPPQATFYAACNNANLLAADNNGQTLGLVNNGFAPNNPVINTLDAYSCCVACMSTAGCTSTNLIPALAAQGQGYQLDVFDTCPAGRNTDWREVCYIC